MTLIERAELALKQHNEAICLVNKLGALKAELGEVEKQLEARLNSIETINIEEVNVEIEKTNERLSATKDVLARLETLEDYCIEDLKDPSIDLDVPIDAPPPCSSSSPREATTEKVDPPTPDEMAKSTAFCEKLDQEERRDRKYDINSILIDDELEGIDGNPDKVVNDLERQFNIGPTDEEVEDFVLYFNRSYFMANGKKLPNGDYEALIKTIYSKEENNEKTRLEWLYKLKDIHYLMFNENCLADLNSRIEELESNPF